MGFKFKYKHEIIAEVALRANKKRIIKYNPKDVICFIDDVLEDAIESIIDIYHEVKEEKTNG